MDKLWVRDEVKADGTGHAAQFIEKRFSGAVWGKTEVMLYWGESLAQMGVPGRMRITSGANHDGKKRRTGKWFNLIIRARKNIQFPYPMKVAVRSVNVKDKVSAVLMGRKFFYEFEDVTFRDLGEVFAYFTGVALLKPLKAAGLNEEPLTKTGMARFALKLLGEFRAWKVEPVEKSR